MSNNPTPYGSIRQAISNVAAGRARKRTARISPEPVTTNTQFAIEEHASWNDQTQEFQTVEDCTHYLLACSCCVTSPNHIRGICPVCAHSIWARFRKPRFICKNHTMCLRCRARKLRIQQGRTYPRRVLAALLWPMCDVTNNDETQQPPEQ
ncbi:MAG TPA: hypothetical protein PLM14_14145 [Candidatus Hydrogenedentes bacterium]|nr:hypothetical protein [Candidatus Hydrogenedentota bacterium]HQH54780.1 hypothetical protein [Candidatus Hydrogenedentota bacterium]